MSFPAALVREERLELSRLTAQASKTCVSAIPPFPLERPSPQPIGESLWVAMHNSEDEIEAPLSSGGGVYGPCGGDVRRKALEGPSLRPACRTDLPGRV